MKTKLSCESALLEEIKINTYWSHHQLPAHQNKIPTTGPILSDGKQTQRSKMWQDIPTYPCMETGILIFQREHCTYTSPDDPEVSDGIAQICSCRGYNSPIYVHQVDSKEY